MELRNLLNSEPAVRKTAHSAEPTGESYSNAAFPTILGKRMGDDGSQSQAEQPTNGAQFPPMLPSGMGTPFSNQQGEGFSPFMKDPAKSPNRTKGPAMVAPVVSPTSQPLRQTPSTPIFSSNLPARDTPFGISSGIGNTVGQHGFVDDKKETRTTLGEANSAVQTALRIVERFKTGSLQAEIPNVELSSQWQIPEYPVVLGVDSYDATAHSSWQNTWRTDGFEKAYPEVIAREEKTGKDFKRKVSELRLHAATSAEEDIWSIHPFSILHQPSCVQSKKNAHCLGCSSYWKFVQYAKEPIRPWGKNDMLRLEPTHSSTFQGSFAMHGSFIPQRIEPLGCDYVNTLFAVDEEKTYTPHTAFAAVVLWGFISPAEISKIAEDETLNLQLFAQPSSNSGEELDLLFRDPSILEKKIKIQWALQRPGQTVVVPSGWGHFCVRLGAGLSLSASWNLLREKHIVQSRRVQEINRTMGLFKPIDISSICVFAAYEKLEELQLCESLEQKREILEMFAKLLPILKVLVLEEIFGEKIAISSVPALCYDILIEKLIWASTQPVAPPTSPGSLMGQVAAKKQMRFAPSKHFSGLFLTEVLNARTSSLKANYGKRITKEDQMKFEAEDEDDEEEDDDQDIKVYCHICKYVLFGTRRVVPVPTQKTLNFCESCYHTFGKNYIPPNSTEQPQPSNQTKRKRGSLKPGKRVYRLSSQNLMALVDSIKLALHEFEMEEKQNPSTLQKIFGQNHNLPSPVPPPAASSPSQQDASKPANGVSSKVTTPEPTSTMIIQNTAITTAPGVIGSIGTTLGKKDGTKPKRERARGGASEGGEEEKSGEPDYSEEVIECVCGNNKDLGYMISCERCYVWLHGKCVGISKRNEPEQYYCPNCVAALSKKK